MTKATAVFTEEFGLGSQKITRQLSINDNVIATETLNSKVNSKLKYISQLMQEMEFGKEFKQISQSEFKIILDVYETSEPEYFKRWLISKML